MKKVIWLQPFHLHLNPTFYQTLTVDDEIIFIESDDWMKTVNYHKKRLVMLLSAQRHFAAALKESGFKVTTYEGSFKDALANYQDVSFITFEITDKGLHKKVLAAFERAAQPFDIRSTPSFLLTPDALPRFLKRPFKMDGFYRLIRHHFKILMDKDKPVGGQYSYDALNRQKLPKGVHIEPPLYFTPDALTLKTMVDIEALNDHPGSVDGFKAPVTHQEAQTLFDHFLKHRLHTFGPYQDALVSKNHEVSHSLISQALNIGLLDPLEVIQKAEAMLQENVLLASVEGFIRQIIWREYIRGIYLSMEDDYDESNYLDHQNPLPHYYWDADTKMACVKDSVTGVIDDAYAHHIERLMVLGNFANLAGIKPKEVNDWFNIMFIDSHDWVVTPNVIGMALFADGGKMATKPYISSGAYIHKMGDHCDSCYYDVKQKTGDRACPFNALYWDYIDRHQEKLASNPRMGIPLSTLNKMSPDNKDALLTQAKIWLSHLESL